MTIQGELQTRDYHLFQVGPGDGTGPDTIVFEGAQRAARAFPGDTVLWDSEKGVCELVTRAPGTLFLVGLLELAGKTRYGMTSRGAPLFRFTPYSEAYPPFFVGCSAKDLSRNVVARIQFESWPADSTCPRGVLVQTFGPAGSLEVEEEALLAHWSGGLRWKRGEVAAEALALPTGWEELPRLEEGVTFHVDPAGCRDIDDAVTFIPRLNDCVEVQIHIADVGGWLAANPALAARAAALGQTLYRDGVAVRPMFPLELSEGLFSLLPGEERAVWSLVLLWDRRGGGFGALPRWVRQKIRVTESYSYESVVGSQWAEPLAAFAGALAGREVTDSHEWIEQLMLLYNREVARVLKREGRGLLRRHAGPVAERFSRLAALGLPAERLAMAAGEYCEVGGGTGAPEGHKHWGLNLEAYCHASSPIRRFADCVNQMVLAGLAGVIADAASLNRLGKAAKSYERDLAFARAILGGRPGEQLEAVVAGEGKLWVPAWGRLVRAGVEGLADGQRVRVCVYCDAGKRNWKRRLVLRISGVPS